MCREDKSGEGLFLDGESRSESLGMSWDDTINALADSDAGRETGLLGSGQKSC